MVFPGLAILVILVMRSAGEGQGGMWRCQIGTGLRDREEELEVRLQRWEVENNQSKGPEVSAECHSRGWDWRAQPPGPGRPQVPGQGARTASQGGSEHRRV